MKNIELELPEFANAVNNEKGDKILFHHQAFKTTENELLGAAIKYATSKGKNVEIISDLYPDNLLLEKLNNSEDFIKKDGTTKNQAIVITKN